MGRYVYLVVFWYEFGIALCTCVGLGLGKWVYNVRTVVLQI